MESQLKICKKKKNYHKSNLRRRLRQMHIIKIALQNEFKNLNNEIVYCFVCIRLYYNTCQLCVFELFNFRIENTFYILYFASCKYFFQRVVKLTFQTFYSNPKNWIVMWIFLNAIYLIINAYNTVCNRLYVSS